jgi:hypothetical protein
MHYSRTLFISLIFAGFFSLPLQSQHHTDLVAATAPPFQTAIPVSVTHETPGEEHMLKHHRFSLLMYHNYLNIETAEGPHLLIIPALGLDYEYWINDHWGLGLHNDVVITHRIEHNMLSGRTYPFLTTLDGLWKPYKGLVFLLGPGMEFEEEQQVFFIRGGIEYEIELGHHWDFSPTIFYDNRKSAFNTCSIGLGFGKKF